ncbi:hypothetical protein BOW51_01645 [Solemya velesiana gill symbiont]|uniref:Uncharacterized protein n=1 Tax=Solemya velesiana gill symbiont TaxID=1918948 RepID=A0A1T2KXI8_9GAMM|nr:hypothetical protein BOW51_01645 [Solemya velesiana gill symbiont]
MLNNKHIYVQHNKEPLNVKSIKGNNARILDDTHWYDEHISKMIEAAEKADQKLSIHIKPIHLNNINVSIEEAVDILRQL